MAKKLNSLFAKTGRRAAEAITQGANPLSAIEDLGSEVSAVFSQQYRTVIDTFAGRVFSSQQAKQELAFYELVDLFFRNHGAEQVRSVTNTTRNQISRAVSIARADGLGVDETAKLVIQRTSGAIGRSRAATIARTETHAAASYATDEATRQLNLPNQKKRWVSVGDGRTRPSHAAANGQEVSIDDPFIIRDKGSNIEMQYPHDGSGGPSNNINCRCIAVYFTDDDDLFDDLDFTGEESPLGRSGDRQRRRPRTAEILEGGDITEKPEVVVEGFVRPRDKAITAASLSIPSRARAAKEIRESVSDANDAEIYKDNFQGGFIGYWQSRNETDNGKAKLGGLTKESVGFINQANKEINYIADWVGIPRVRGYKSSRKASINGSMGGGVMELNRDAINGYSSLGAIGGNALSLNKIEKVIEEQRDIYRKAKEELQDYRALRGTSDYKEEIEDELFRKVMDEQKKYFDYLDESSLARDLINRGGGVTTWQRGDPYALMPWSTKEYFADGLDKTRVLVYHEFGHHLHQSYKLDTYYESGKTYIEKRLNAFWSAHSKSALEAYAPSRYAMTNEKEYFVESFAMYMMDRVDDLHPEMIKLIEKVLRDRGQ